MTLYAIRMLGHKLAITILGKDKVKFYNVYNKVLLCNMVLNWLKFGKGI